MATSLRNRPARVIPTLVVCLILLLAICGLLVWLITGYQSQDFFWGDELYQLTVTPADNTVVLIAAGALILCGLWLLYIAITPGGKRFALLESQKDSTFLAVTTTGMANLAASVAENIDGVQGVHATASDKKVTLRVRTQVEDNKAMKEEIEQAVQARFADLNFAKAPKIVVHAKGKVS